MKILNEEFTVPILTLLLIFSFVIVFILQMITNLTYDFAFTPSDAFIRPWTFFTSIFLHADIFHLLWNILFLLLFGTFLEKIVNKKVFLLIFFISGFIGNLAFMFTMDTAVIGSSGAIFGLAGCLIIVRPFVLSIWSVIIWCFTIGLIIRYILGLFYLTGIAGIYIVGLPVGIAFGLYLKSKKPLAKVQV